MLGNSLSWRAFELRIQGLLSRDTRLFRHMTPSKTDGEDQEEVTRYAG